MSPARPVLAAVTALAFAAGFTRSLHRPSPPSFRVATSAPQAEGRRPSAPGERRPARPRSRFASKTHDVTAHAASLVELGDGRLRAFWFSGADEGTSDVRILTAVFDPLRDAWTEARTVVEAGGLGRGLFRHVGKLGNPAAIRTSDGTLWLFVVTVPFGGWANSAVTGLRSADDGETWGMPRRLVATPLFNRSTMVRGAPFEYGDGTLGLPAYQSLLRGFAEVLRVDASGAVVDKQRLSTPGQGSQPSVMVTGESDAVALLRPSGQPPPRRAMLSRTRDAGEQWTPPAPVALRSPDAALEGLALPGGRLLAVLNDTDLERDALSLVVSDDDGWSWRTVERLEDQGADRALSPDDGRYARTVEALARATDATVADASPYVRSSRRFMCWDERCHFEFSYPSLVRARGGEIHLLYTWNRAYIKHVRFDPAWLDERLADPSNAPLR
ncbi:MAG TPA: sialidase family protein [Vicinamibacteria bacterium]